MNLIKEIPYQRNLIIIQEIKMGQKDQKTLHQKPI